MPREEAHFGYPRKGHSRSYVTAEEAAGIGILTVVLGIALLIGCWYCRRRSGYRTLTEKRLHAGTQSILKGRCLSEQNSCDGLGHQDSPQSFQEKNHQPVVPNAPPAYEKLSSDRAPPPYAP
ncbi:melanoma antigen recognized by T-cells 1 [Onychomys torridus]|uniref:melanoma antigen recognized by T-cells 1 n=1 Tax=Onychomys torridus TaxID=38674 RepID=UPI00167FBE2F|nr:melanoma antigen recognized by T-cells 1 [Onychomys torridus]